MPKPVPSAATHRVENAADASVRFERSAADQKDVENSDEIVVKNPNHAIQNLTLNFPICFGAFDFQTYRKKVNVCNYIV